MGKSGQKRSEVAKHSHKNSGVNKAGCEGRQMRFKCDQFCVDHSSNNFHVIAACSADKSKKSALVGVVGRRCLWANLGWNRLLMGKTRQCFP